ncbi:MAG TPA: hypothetical protein VHM91_10865 [Verrucomicrobiales bacterium]|nr:hypothetical protein [Verrucomicrobiales bacterium]
MTNSAASPAPRRNWTDWFTPLMLFMPAAGWGAISGNEAEQLGLPSVWFARTAHVWMIGIAAVSLLLRPGKLSFLLRVVAVFCMFYGPLLVQLGSASIPLSRPLSIAEGDDLHRQLDVPFVWHSRELRVRRADDTPPLRARVESLIESLPGPSGRITSGG